MKKGRQLYYIFKVLQEKKKNYQVRIVYPKQPSDMKEKQRYFQTNTQTRDLINSKFTVNLILKQIC